MKRSIVLAALLVAAAILAGPAGGQSAPDDAETRFWEARRVLLTRDPATAAELFRVLASEHPQGERADDSLYWMGRAFLRTADREPDAVVAFLRLVEEHPESEFLDDAAAELARLGDGSAVATLRKRAAGSGRAAELATAALSAFQAPMRGPMGETPPAAKDLAPGAAAKDPEIEALRAEVARLRKDLEECLTLVRRLVAEKEKNR